MVSKLVTLVKMECICFGHVLLSMRLFMTKWLNDLKWPQYRLLVFGHIWLWFRSGHCLLLLSISRDGLLPAILKLFSVKLESFSINIWKLSYLIFNNQTSLMNCSMWGTKLLVLNHPIHPIILPKMYQHSSMLCFLNMNFVIKVWFITNECFVINVKMVL